MEGRDKRFQAVYKLRGKILNTTNKEIHEIRKNKEIDDLISILRCGIGRDFSLEKLKFSKVVILADADDDGSHIELLFTTLMHEHFKSLIENGNVYIGMAPLYKVSIPNQPIIYIDTKEELADFIKKQIEIQFEIQYENKKLKPSQKTELIEKVLEYQNLINKFKDNYNIDTDIIERVLLMNFYQDEDGALDLGDRIDFIDVGNYNFTIVGFYQDEDNSKEYFLSTTTNDLFLDKLIELQNLFLEISPINFTDKKKNTEIQDTSFIELVDNLLDKIKRNMKISRLKGLGEMNADELWDTSLNPETRRLIQVKLIEDSDLVVQQFMGKDPEYRKEFLKEVFADAMEAVEEV